nr:hypothetical protein [Tanacetum cinerariifolium]
MFRFQARDLSVSVMACFLCLTFIELSDSNELYDLEAQVDVELNSEPYDEKAQIDEELSSEPYDEESQAVHEAELELS